MTRHYIPRHYIPRHYVPKYSVTEDNTMPEKVHLDFLQRVVRFQDDQLPQEEVEVLEQQLRTSSSKRRIFAGMMVRSMQLHNVLRRRGWETSDALRRRGAADQQVSQYCPMGVTACVALIAISVVQRRLRMRRG